MIMQYTRAEYCDLPITLGVCIPNGKVGTTARGYALLCPGSRRRDTRVFQQLYGVYMRRNV
jgi:hypothetical protein